MLFSGLLSNFEGGEQWAHRSTPVHKRPADRWAHASRMLLAHWIGGPEFDGFGEIVEPHGLVDVGKRHGNPRRSRTADAQLDHGEQVNHIDVVTAASRQLALGPNRWSFVVRRRQSPTNPSHRSHTGYPIHDCAGTIAHHE